MSLYINTGLTLTPVATAKIPPAATSEVEDPRYQQVRETFIKEILREKVSTSPITTRSVDPIFQQKIVHELTQLGWSVFCVTKTYEIGVTLCFPSKLPTDIVVPKGWKDTHSALSVHRRITDLIQKQFTGTIKRIEDHKDHKYGIATLLPIPLEALDQLQKIIKGSGRECYIEWTAQQMGMNDASPVCNLHILNPTGSNVEKWSN